MNRTPIPPHATVVQVEDLSTAVDVLLDIILKMFPDASKAPPDVFEAAMRVERAKGAAAIAGATAQLWKVGAERPPGDVAISLERHHQIRDRGFTLEHDRRHDRGELVTAALFYLVDQTKAGSLAIEWPWPDEEATVYDDRSMDLRVAGALIAAEYDRLAP